MNRKTILLLLLLASFSGISQNSSIQDTLYYDKDWREATKIDYYYYSTFSKSSIKYLDKELIYVTDHYKNGITQMTGYKTAIESSERIGLYSFYTKKGKLECHRLYKYDKTINDFPVIKEFSSLVKKCNDTNIDFFVSFFPKGEVKEAGYLSAEDISICQWIEYNPIGKKIYYLFEIKNCQKDGAYKMFYSKDKLWKEGFYKEGKRSGIWKIYDHSGTLKKENIYQNDKLVEKKKY